MKEYYPYIEEIFALELFPQNMNHISICQGNVSDCHLLTCVDCLIHMGSPGQAFLKSLFTITSSAILVKIHSSSLLNEENKARAVERYRYRYEPSCQEHRFFVPTLDSIFDWRAQSLKTNAYAITILEHLISYFYTIALNDDSKGVSLAAHERKNRHQGYVSTEFLAKTLGLGLLSFEDKDFTLRELIQFKRIHPDYPVYLSLKISMDGSRHAYRLKSIQSYARRLHGILVNPWNNQKEEIWPLSLIEKQKPHAGIFFLDSRQVVLTKKLLTLPEEMGRFVFANPLVEKALLEQPDYQEEAKIKEFIENHSLYLNKKPVGPRLCLEGDDLCLLHIQKGIEELAQTYKITDAQAKTIVYSGLNSFFATNDLRLLIPRNLRTYFKNHPLDIGKIPDYLQEEPAKDIEKAMATIIDKTIKERVNLFGVSLEKAKNEVWFKHFSLYLFNKLIELSPHHYHYMEDLIVGPANSIPLLFDSSEDFLNAMTNVILASIENTSSIRDLVGKLGPFQPAFKKATKHLSLKPEEISTALEKLELAYKKKFANLSQKNDALNEKKNEILETLKTLGDGFEECKNLDGLKLKKQRLETQLIEMEGEYDKIIHAIMDLGMTKPSTFIKFQNTIQKISCLLRLKLGSQIATRAKTLWIENPEDSPYQLIGKKPSLFEHLLEEKIKNFKLSFSEREPSLTAKIIFLFDEAKVLKEGLEVANSLETKKRALVKLRIIRDDLRKNLNILIHLETNKSSHQMELIDLKIAKELFLQEFKDKEIQLESYYQAQLETFKQLSSQNAQNQGRSLNFFSPGLEIQSPYLKLDSNELYISNP